MWDKLIWNNIFINMNMKLEGVKTKIADIHKVLGSPFRIKLLYTIGYGESCVCHLESILNKRQAYISQHLMVLRDAGFLHTRRDGKYIYYRVSSEDVFKLLAMAGEVGGIKSDQLPVPSSTVTEPDCVCPNCN